MIRIDIDALDDSITDDASFAKQLLTEQNVSPSFDMLLHRALYIVIRILYTPSPMTRRSPSSC
jgi:hypothetical protein